MGRPLNKKFFGDGAGKIACTADIGAGAELCFITEQRSNAKYRVDSEVGPSTRTGVCVIVDTAPALNEMRVEVQAENAETPLTANIAFTSSGGTGALLTVSLDNAAYGYWAAGTNVAIGGTTDGTVDYTVANGRITSVTINTAGSANTQAGSPVALADAAAANPPLEYARIINARQVKTFEGNTFDWPITAPLGTPAPNGLTQADLQTQ